METLDCFGVRIALGEAATPELKHDNDDWEAKPDWMTPAELMQLVHRTRKEMVQELIDDPSRISCPEHRLFWLSLHGLEAFARWHYFREA